MTRPSSGRTTFTAGSVVLGMALGVLGTFALSGGPGSVVRAQSHPATSPDSSGTVVLNLSVPGGPSRIALVDTREKALAVYRIDPAQGALKLEASRPYRFDLKLEYNNLEPYSHAVEAMVTTTSRK